MAGDALLPREGMPCRHIADLAVRASRGNCKNGYQGRPAYQLPHDHHPSKRMEKIVRSRARVEVRDFVAPR
jgi:hypothetical protein